jgi:hypothetical protein
MPGGDDDTGRDRLQATLEWNGDRGLTSPSAGRKGSSMAIMHRGRDASVGFAETLAECQCKIVPCSGRG